MSEHNMHSYGSPKNEQTVHKFIESPEHTEHLMSHFMHELSLRKYPDIQNVHIKSP